MGSFFKTCYGVSDLKDRADIDAVGLAAKMYAKMVSAPGNMVPLGNRIQHRHHVQGHTRHLALDLWPGQTHHHLPYPSGHNLHQRLQRSFP